ncbi:MAG: sigma-70 family RNA polymerase sigma factor, partial [Planctomycetota bacterium]
MFDRHAAAVRSVVAAVSADFASTEDLTQETFLRAYRLIDRLRVPADFGPWAGGIARRVARERRRSLLRDRHEFVSDVVRGESKDAGPAEQSSRDEETAMLLRYVAELPERERLTLHAFYF